MQQKKLKMNKAVYNDRISNEIIKFSVTFLSLGYVKLFNNILTSGRFPKKWTEGLISPIYKSGNSLDPNNYRGVCVSRLHTRFLWLSQPDDPERQHPSLPLQSSVVWCHLFTTDVQPILESHLDHYHSEVTTNMKEHLYVENLISGQETEDDIIHYYQSARSIMGSGHFNLQALGIQRSKTLKPVLTRRDSWS